MLGPFLMTAAVLCAVWFVAGPDYVRRLLVMAVATLSIFGRFIILAGNDPDIAQLNESMNSTELFFMVFYLDVAVAMVLAFHLGFLFRLPVLGWRLKELIVDGRFILSRQPWIGRVTFLGLVSFVAFPLAATGSVGGSIFGRLLGLSRWATFCGIVIGSLIGNGSMLWASDFIGEHFDKNHPAIKYGGIAIVLGVILFLESRYRRMRNEYARKRPARLPMWKPHTGDVAPASAPGPTLLASCEPKTMSNASSTTIEGVTESPVVELPEK